MKTGTGVVKFFNATKEFGFITPENGEKDLFVHSTQVTGEAIHDGDQVEYEIGHGRKGIEAHNVRKML